MNNILIDRKEWVWWEPIKEGAYRLERDQRILKLWIILSNNGQGVHVGRVYLGE